MAMLKLILKDAVASTYPGAALGISTDGFETSHNFQQKFTEFRINFLKAQEQLTYRNYWNSQIVRLRRPFARPLGSTEIKRAKS